MMEWIQEHPYLSGGLVLSLLVLYLLLRRSGGGTSVVSTGPSEALQAANLQAQTQQAGISAAANAQTQTLQAALAAKQIDAQVTQNAIDATTQQASIAAAMNLGIAKLSADAQLSAIDIGAQRDITVSGQQSDAAKYIASVTADAQTKIAEGAYARDISVAGIGAARDVSVAGIQSTTLQAQYAAALATQKDIDATSLGINRDNWSGAAALASIQAGVDMHISDNNTGVANNYINTQGAVQLADLTFAHDIQSQSIGAQFQLQSQNQSSFWASVMGNDRWGNGNQQVAALSAIVGQPAIGVAASSASAVQAQATASNWSAFWGGLFGTAQKGIAAAA